MKKVLISSVIVLTALIGCKKDVTPSIKCGTVVDYQHVPSDTVRKYTNGRDSIGYAIITVNYGEGCPVGQSGCSLSVEHFPDLSTTSWVPFKIGDQYCK